MKNRFETKFIQKTIEKTPFSESPAQNFFAEWCKINGSIKPRFLSRKEWERKMERQKDTENILEKSNEEETLFLPEDLQLWEMIDVMEAVDADTYSQKPELREKKSRELKRLGGTFQKAGVYLGHYSDSVGQGKEIAQETANRFYEYGLSLRTGTKQPTNIKEIRKETLTNEEKRNLDEWLLGNTAYQKRIEALKNKYGENISEDVLEEQRKKQLSVYFGALTRKGYREKFKSEQEYSAKEKTKAWEEYCSIIQTPEKDLADVQRKRKENLEKIIFTEKPWEISQGPFQRLRDRAKKQITGAIETPERELKGSIFRRGMELLQNSIGFDKLREELDVLDRKSLEGKMLTSEEINRGAKLKYTLDYVLHWRNGEKTLREALGIDRLKAELNAVRQQGDLAEIGKKEYEIALKIQSAVSAFPYKSDADTPSKMIESQLINCVGASVLGGALLDETGIKYLHANIPRHAFTFLITSDEKLYWHDMLAPHFNRLITNEDLGGIAKEEIIAFSKNPEEQYLNFEVKFDSTERFLRVFKPEAGQKINILDAAGIVLSELKRYEEAIEAFRQAISLDLKNSNSYIGLGGALNKLERREEAIEAFRQAIFINPKESVSYNGLGNALNSLEHYEEAIEAFRRAISLDPKDSAPYNGLGNALNSLECYEEAIEVFRQAISLDPKEGAFYNGLGDALKGLGRKKEAIEAYKKFIELYKEGDKYWIDRAKKIIKQLES